jgi:chaperonin GroES
LQAVVEKAASASSSIFIGKPILNRLKYEGHDEGETKMPQGPISNRRLIVVGDRVLIKIGTGEERTDAGLILPQTVADKAQVQSGRIVAVGPGVPMPFGEDDEDEPWRQSERRARYIPMQAEVGDQALFLRKAMVEIKYDGETYLIGPQSAILVLLRKNADHDADGEFQD